MNPRYTDFLVNEILPSGQVVHLDNLKLPARKQQEKSREAETPSSATVNDSNPARSDAAKPVPEPIPEPVFKPVLKVTSEAASIPMSEPLLEPATATVPESVPVTVRGPEPASGHSVKAEVPQDESFSADPAAKWQAYANEPSAIQVREKKVL